MINKLMITLPFCVLAFALGLLSNDINYMPLANQAFPEGFVRYKIYVNVEGVNLETHKTDDKFWIRPLTALPMDQDQLRMMLREYPLTKNDLAAVLKSGSISKEYIREILSEYGN